MSDMLTDPGMLDAANTAVLQAQGQKVDDGVRDHIKRIRGQLAQAFAHDKDARDRYVRLRKLAAGDSKWKVDTNLIGAIIEILMAFIYAKNPDISVTPSDSVDDFREKQYGDVTRTLEIVVSRLLRDARLKKKAKKWVRSAMTVGPGWLRATMQTRTETIHDPVVQNEINDLKQQLDNIAALQQEAAEGCGNQDELRSRIEAQMTALQAKLERQVGTGLVLDVPAPEDVQVAPDCGELENYLDASFIRLRFYKSKAEVLAITGWSEDDLKGANLYFQRPASEANGQGGQDNGNHRQEWLLMTDSAAQTTAGFYLVEEVQHKADGVVYTLVDGIHHKWARAPYAPRQSSRFYDVFLLAFHYIDGERHPQSDVQQLERLQDEYGRTRSNFAEHRKRAIPKIAFDQNQIDDTDAKKIADGQIGEMVGIKLRGEDIGKAMKEISYPQFDPRLYDTQPITTDMEKVSGAQDAMQSGVAVEKTATEAEIQNNGFGARIGTRKDELEDVLSDLAMHVTQIALQTLTEDYVRKIAGPMAVWPKLSVDDILTAFDVEVKAGSTGKPNTAQQRNAWQAMLPILEKVITVIGNLKANPQMAWGAAPYEELLKETARVLEYKGDVDKLIPNPPTMPAGLPGMPGANPAAAAAGALPPALAQLVPVLGDAANARTPTPA
jgi:hypothetical protein